MVMGNKALVDFYEYHRITVSMRTCSTASRLPVHERYGKFPRLSAHVQRRVSAWCGVRRPTKHLLRARVRACAWTRLSG